MLEVKLLKDIKKSPVVEYEIPKKIFFKHDTEMGRQGFEILVKTL